MMLLSIVLSLLSVIVVPLDVPPSKLANSLRVYDFSSVLGDAPPDVFTVLATMLSAKRWISKTNWEKGVFCLNPSIEISPLLKILLHRAVPIL